MSAASNLAEASNALAQKRRPAAKASNETPAWLRHVIATPRPSWAERRAIRCPNRHASLPCPARESVEATLRDLSGELALLGVTAIGLFGSVARGDDTADSDVDVAALFADDDFTTRLVVNDLLERHFNRHVDVARLPFHPPLSTLANGDMIMVW